MMIYFSEAGREFARFWDWPAMATAYAQYAQLNGYGVRLELVDIEDALMPAAQVAIPAMTA